MAKTLLQYKFPDRRQEAEAIKQMPPDRVGKLRDEIKFRLEGLLASCDDYFENLIESYCGVCEKFGYGYFDLPPEWGWLDNGLLLCDDCQNKWEKRFGTKPKAHRETEIVNDDSSVSKDTTLGRQTNFEFI